MEHPLECAASGIGKMYFAGPFQWYAGTGSAIAASIGSNSSSASVHDRKVTLPCTGDSVSGSSIRSPLAKQVPCMIHGSDVRYQHRRMSWHC